MRILFASHLADPFASGRQRRDALRTLGHDVVSFAFDGYDRQSSFARRLRVAFSGSFFRDSDLDHVGRAFTAAVQATKPDVVWAEKPLMLRHDWVSAARALVPGARFVSFQDDDPFGPRVAERPVWGNFIRAIPEYDVHFVKKRVNVEEYRSQGAENVFLFMHGVHAPIFHPRSLLPASTPQQVVFVGTPLDHRVGYVSRLFELKVPLSVYGNHWHRHSVYWRNRNRFHGAVVAEEYASLLAQSRICLGFVSSSNRDEYSMRTFEIPGCASFFLAERTPVHQALFEEGVEADFFGSPEECASKCKYYLAHEELRSRIARAGYERCLRSGYLLEHRMRDALELVNIAGGQLDGRSELSGAE